MADGTEELVMTNNVAPVVHGHWDRAVDPFRFGNVRSAVARYIGT